MESSTQDKASPNDGGGWKDPQADVIKLEMDQVFQAVLVAKQKCKNNSMLYTFDTGDKVVKLFGTAVLDDRMLPIEVGNEVRIIYRGKRQLEGGKSCHDFEVKYREPIPK